MKVEAFKLAEEAIARCRLLASFSEDSGSIRRTFLSQPMRDIHRELTRWLEPLGATVWVDAVGNLRALYPAKDPVAASLLIGSHLDTVPNAGPYDGILGVVLAVALLQNLDGRRLPFAIEIVGFSEEEGVRFGTPFIGSRALIGRIDDNLLTTQDAHGITLQTAIQNFGLNPAEVPKASLQGDAAAYVEFHIEQGPILDELNLPLASVEAIAGQSRLELTFVGRTNHAGTTPMDLRLDSLVGAAEWITIVEHITREIPGLVATVGSVRAEPGVANVIAGETRLSLDVRHRNDAVRVSAVETLFRRAVDVAHRRGLSVRSSEKVNQLAVAMDPFLTDNVEEAIRKTGCKPHRMVSGAGHDAMIIAEKIPSAMIFLRTPGGISHHPNESVALDDVAKAIECGAHLLDQLALTPSLQTRTCRA